MIETTTILPIFNAPGARESKYSTRKQKRDWGFTVIMTIMFVIGVTIGSLLQSSRTAPQLGTLLCHFTYKLAIPWGPVKTAILPEGWQELRPGQLISPNSRELIQHHFLNLARKSEKINGGPTEVFYNRNRPDAAIFKEHKWPSRANFYKKYVSKSTPVVLRGYAKQFDAFEKWKTDDYITSKIGDVEVRVETSKDNRYTGDRSKMKFTLFKFADFLSHYSRPNREQNYYLAQTDMKTFAALHTDFPTYPKIFGKHMKHDVTQLWYGAGGQVTPMHFDENENILCQIHGSRTFTLIDPYFNDMVYIDGITTHVYTLVDPHTPDLKKYPLFKYTRQLKVKVNAGDCIYLPSFWYHKVESAQGRNVAINWWYMPASNVANTAWVALSARQWRNPDTNEDLVPGRKTGKTQ
jgi:hypothetical protein